MAGEQRHAAEHAGLVTDHFVVVSVVAFVARVKAEAGNLIDAHSTDEVRTDANRTAAGNAAAAFHATVENVNVFGELRVHRHFLLAKVDFLVLHVNPCFHAFGHVAHPLAGVDRKVADEFERRQGGEREFRRKILGKRTAGEAGLAVDQHGAAAANTSAANEVELQGRILLVAQIVERNEERHRVRFLELVRLHVRNAVRILRVVAQDADLEHAVLLLSSGSGRGGGSRRGLLSFLGHFCYQLQISRSAVRRCVRCGPAGAWAAGADTA